MKLGILFTIKDKNCWLIFFLMMILDMKAWPMRRCCIKWSMAIECRHLLTAHRPSTKSCWRHGTKTPWSDPPSKHCNGNSKISSLLKGLSTKKLPLPIDHTQTSATYSWASAASRNPFSLPILSFCWMSFQYLTVSTLFAMPAFLKKFLLLFTKGIY